jgi:hypothetical protein
LINTSGKSLLLDFQFICFGQSFRAYRFEAVTLSDTAVVRGKHEKSAVEGVPFLQEGGELAEDSVDPEEARDIVLAVVPFRPLGTVRIVRGHGHAA